MATWDGTCILTHRCFCFQGISGLIVASLLFGVPTPVLRIFFVHLYLVRKGRFGVEATWMIRWEGFSKWYFVRCFWMLPARSICIKLLCIAIKVRAIKIWYRCYLWNPLVSNINSVEFFEETPSLKKHGPNSFRDLHGVAVPRCWKVDIWRRTPPDSS